MSTYSNVVRLAFAGHTHMDDFRVTAADPSLLPLRITPAVSPIYKNNPAILRDDLRLDDGFGL